MSEQCPHSIMALDPNGKCMACCIAELEAKIKRLESRGIEDMHQRIAELEFKLGQEEWRHEPELYAENVALKAQLEKALEQGDES